MTRPTWVRYLGLGIVIVGAGLLGMTWALEPHDPVALQRLIASVILIAGGWLLVGNYRFASRKGRQ